jgi:hypothetical protein
MGECILLCVCKQRYVALLLQFLKTHQYVAPPTQGRVYQQLCEQEYIAELAGSKDAGTAHFINTGIRIEADQCVINYSLLMLVTSWEVTQVTNKSFVAGEGQVRS